MLDPMRRGVCRENRSYLELSSFDSQPDLNAISFGDIEFDTPFG